MDKLSLPQKQQGVALMMVIMVFALVSILAVGMHNRQSLFIQLSGNSLAQAQAYQYAVASEIYGKRLLKADWDEDKEDNEFVDDLEQVKNSILLPADEAFIEAQFNDIHGKLNINDLVNLDGTKNEVMEKRFKRLVDYLDIQTIKVEMLIDWIDDNTEPTGLEGIEDGAYQLADPPYRAGNQPLQDISEILLLAGGFDVEAEAFQKDYEKILPFVTVMPRGMCAINVNTAPAEVLQSLNDKITKSIAEALVAAREKEPWPALKDFTSDSNLNGITIDETYLDVKSEFFEIASKITLSDRVVRLVSVIHRANADGAMTLIKRDQGQKYLITKEKVSPL